MVDIVLLTVCSVSVLINIYLILKQHLDSIQNDNLLIGLLKEKVKSKRILEDEKATNSELLNETERLNALLSRLRDYYENRLSSRFER